MESGFLQSLVTRLFLQAGNCLPLPPRSQPPVAAGGRERRRIADWHHLRIVRHTLAGVVGLDKFPVPVSSGVGATWTISRGKCTNRTCTVHISGICYRARGAWRIIAGERRSNCRGRRTPAGPETQSRATTNAYETRTSAFAYGPCGRGPGGAGGDHGVPMKAVVLRQS